MQDLCLELFHNFTLTDEYENFTFKHFAYPNDVEIWKQPGGAACVKLFAYAVIIVGGLLGNTGVILTIAINRNMRTTINYYIANLAVADATICVICMVPHAISVLTENVFVLGEFMCKFNPFTQMTCLTCSVLTLSAISCDRFMAVMFPLQRRVTKQRTSVVMTAVWVISALVSTPFLFVKKHIVTEWRDFLEPKCIEKWPVSYTYDQLTSECLPQEPMKTAYYVAMSATLFFVPVVIMISAYSLIILKLWRTEIPGEQHEANVNAQSRAKRKVIKMVFTVLIAFVICWTPIQAKFLYLASEDVVLPDWWSEFEWFSYFFAYANSFINPIIYGGFNKQFRDGFCIVLQCGCKKERLARLARWRSTLSTRLTMNSSRNSSKNLADPRRIRS